MEVWCHQENFPSYCSHRSCIVSSFLDTGVELSYCTSKHYLVGKYSANRGSDSRDQLLRLAAHQESYKKSILSSFLFKNLISPSNNLILQPPQLEFADILNIGKFKYHFWLDWNLGKYLSTLFSVSFHIFDQKVFFYLKFDVKKEGKINGRVG